MLSASFTWRSSSRTDSGSVRDVNEDACLERPDLGLWAVADGMGGHSAGDVASARIVAELDSLGPTRRLGEFVEHVEDRLISANGQLRAIALHEEATAVGSTVAVLLVRDRHAICIWAGDSRIYRCREGEIEQISQDHALVEELVGKGVLTREQAASHPHANLVTRAVGATDRLALDLEVVELAPGDVFVLCSDGLDKEVHSAEIATAVAGAAGASLAGTLVDLALSRGARDNVTVVAVELREADARRASG